MRTGEDARAYTVKSKCRSLDSLSSLGMTCGLNHLNERLSRWQNLADASGGDAGILES